MLFPCLADVGNLISGSSAFSKTSLNIWKFMVHVLLKRGLENFQPYLTGLMESCCCCCQVASVVSDSVQPHRWQPTRVPHPWDSPSKNTGVGCHFLLQSMQVKRKVKSFSNVQLFVTPWTVAYQAPPFMGFSRQEYWCGLPFPSLNKQHK